MSVIRVPLSASRASTTEPSHAQPQIVFTRQLWERTMPSAEVDDLSTSSPQSTNNDRGGRRKVSSNLSQQQTSPKARLSETPLTPEESPPFHESRKRSAEAIDQDEDSPSHHRDGSTDSVVNFCLCQPEPKVPRPRNAFILYRQNHQAGVVARNPGLANPDISKLIGEQWRNEPDEEKNRWKAYAEEEKLQHQQRYPSYRYQPKRSGRRGSVSSESSYCQADQRKCQKCGGRTIIHPTPGTPSSAREQYKSPSQETSPSSAFPQPLRTNTFQLPPPTPSSTTTPSTRYLPMLNNLSLSSPHPRTMSHSRPTQSYMSQQRNDDDHVPPLTPDSKRRRFESPQGTYVMSTTRVMPPRHNAGPGTPFPFGAPPQHNGPMPQGHPQMGPPQQFAGPQGMRRESLPRPTELLRGPGGNSASMGPPPRPGPGYSQHRANQSYGRPGGPELSLTLPPLQSANVAGASSTGRGGSSQPSSGNRPSDAKEIDKRSVSEIIMSMSFMAKVQILGRVAPPSPASDNKEPRGTIIAIEGDSPEAARNLTDWLEEFLSREGDMIVKVIDGPKLPEDDDSEVVQFQDLLQRVSEWHDKSKKIEQVVRGGATASASPQAEAPSRKASDASSKGNSTSAQHDDDAAMDVDSSSTITTTNNDKSSNGKMLVILLRTYTVTASNVFASKVPIRDAYKAADHWQWTATLWRGIVGPDMTVYVKDIDVKEELSGINGNKNGVEIKEENRIMAVRRNKVVVDGKEENSGGGIEGIEAGTLRRLGFEVGEWVRGGSGLRKD